MKMGELEKFRTEKPSAALLREKYPFLSDLLRGEFRDKPNVYQFERGTVVSWELARALTKNPTYGRIPIGHFEFPVDHTEEVTVLEGILDVEFCGERRTIENEMFVVPAGNLLKLDVKKAPVFYFCRYV